MGAPDGYAPQSTETLGLAQLPVATQSGVVGWIPFLKQRVAQGTRVVPIRALLERIRQLLQGLPDRSPVALLSGLVPAQALLPCMIHPPAEVDPVADLLALGLAPFAAEPCTLAGSTPVDTLPSRRCVGGLLDGDPADTIYDTLCTVSCGRLGCACSFLLEEASSPSAYLHKKARSHYWRSSVLVSGDEPQFTNRATVVGSFW